MGRGGYKQEGVKFYPHKKGEVRDIFRHAEEGGDGNKGVEVILMWGHFIAPTSLLLMTCP